jgi:hypothetical protein
MRMISEQLLRKHMPHLQHDMWVYQHLLISAEKKVRRCVENGATPQLLDIAAPRPPIEAFVLST